MKKPDWFKLIDQWVPRGMGGHGVTLPFLVGALAYKSGQTDLDSEHIRNVLGNIIDRPVEGYVTEVSWCGNIEAPVLNVAKIDAKLRMNNSVSFPRPSGESEALVFGQNLWIVWGSKDPASLLESLIRNAADPVTKGKYSRVGGVYTNFQTEELNYIKSTII